MLFSSLNVYKNLITYICEYLWCYFDLIRVFLLSIIEITYLRSKTFIFDSAFIIT